MWYESVSQKGLVVSFFHCECQEVQMDCAYTTDRVFSDADTGSSKTRPSLIRTGFPPIFLPFPFLSAVPTGDAHMVP